MSTNTFVDDDLHRIFQELREDFDEDSERIRRFVDYAANVDVEVSSSFLSHHHLTIHKYMLRACFREEDLVVDLLKKRSFVVTESTIRARFPAFDPVLTWDDGVLAYARDLADPRYSVEINAKRDGTLDGFKFSLRG